MFVLVAVMVVAVIVMVKLSFAQFRIPDRILPLFGPIEFPKIDSVVDGSFAALKPWSIRTAIHHVDHYWN